MAERYLSGGLYLGIGVIRRDGAVGSKVGKHYAIIQVAGAGKHEAHFRVADGEVLHERDLSGGADGNEFHVLVDVRHAEDGAQNLIPSVVRLCGDDSFSQVGIEPLQVAAYADERPSAVSSDMNALAAEVIPAVPDGELNIAELRVAAAEASKGHGGLVKGGTKLVDNLPSEDVHDFWGPGFKDDFGEFVAGIGITIHDDPARVEFEKLTLNSFYLDEVVLCAL